MFQDVGKSTHFYSIPTLPRIITNLKKSKKSKSTIFIELKNLISDAPKKSCTIISSSLSVLMYGHLLHRDLETVQKEPLRMNCECKPNTTVIVLTESMPRGQKLVKGACQEIGVQDLFDSYTLSDMLSRKRVQYLGIKAEIFAEKIPVASEVITDTIGAVYSTLICHLIKKRLLSLATKKKFPSAMWINFCTKN